MSAAQLDKRTKEEVEELVAAPGRRSTARLKEPRVRVGAEGTERLYDVSVFNISALSFGAIGGRASGSLTQGAGLGNFYLDTDEDGGGRSSGAHQARGRASVGWAHRRAQ